MLSGKKKKLKNTNVDDVKTIGDDDKMGKDAATFVLNVSRASRDSKGESLRDDSRVESYGGYYCTTYKGVLLYFIRYYDMKNYITVFLLLYKTRIF